MSYSDAGHRPHAVHTGETPVNTITYGPDSLRVELTTWGPRENIFPVLYDALQSNWGDHPSRTRWNECRCPETPAHHNSIHTPDYCGDCLTGWCKLTPGQHEYLDQAFAGRTLPQVLEGIKLHFTIDGVSRAFTHQNVRTRIGAAFMQHGGRDNDWRHRAWTMPETIRRACLARDGDRPGDPNPTGAEALDAFGLQHCITNWKPIDDLVDAQRADANSDLEEVIEGYLERGRAIYAALVDAGIPWQDARRLLWMGTQTYIHDIYDYLSLKSMLANRLEHIMDWEHNCVAQLMVREVTMRCPPLFSKYLMSHSDAAKQAKFAELESWPPDMKYDPNFPCECGHNRANHLRQDTGESEICLVCNGNSTKQGRILCQKFVPKDPLIRTHRAEQNPFFVLHPSSMAGGPIVWIPTNGTFPPEGRTRAR